MRVITNTNIIVDDFGYCKSFPKNTFIHFLTHFHSDHWDGLTPLWDYSPIYCSQVTASLILNKFPKLEHLVRRCDYYKEYSLDVGHGDLVIKFWLFDAKHIPGSAMFLFQGYMGRILFTGDFRYQFSMVLENQILFPSSIREALIENNKKSSIEDKSWIQSQSNIGIEIDEMIFDNTYCNEMFDFGTETQIFQKVVGIINENKGKKVLITLGALGKNKLLYRISQYFQTLIYVRQDKLKEVQVAGGHTHIFTTNPEEAYIELVKKSHRKQRVEQQKTKGGKFICIQTDFLMLEHHAPDGINFIVPYSVHSNFKQMLTFIKMIGPSTLYKLVIPFEMFKEVRYNKIVDNRLRLAKYLNRLEKIDKSKSGFSFLVKKYTDIRKLSKQYLGWMYPEIQQNLMEALKIGKPDHSLRKRQLVFQEKHFQIQKKKSLHDIASELNASHKNRSLIDMMKHEQDTQDELYQKTYDRIFEI